jgi:arginase family enzyme
MGDSIMKRFKMKFDELVKIWTRHDVEIVAESKEEILKHIQDGDFLSYFDINFVDIEYCYDTVSTVQYGYDTQEAINSIEEI